MRRVLWLALFVPAAQAACPPGGETVASLQALQAKRFLVEDAPARQAMAAGLLDCLADPNPALRDGIAFEALSTWLRGDLLDAETRRGLLHALSAALEPAQADAAGFRQPFSALVLAEVARTDRIAPWLAPDERAALVEAAARYVSAIRDHRGFIDGEGWRHGVAHGADLLMQLALNPALDKAQLDRILAAVAAQVAPDDGHAYIHGESERLARPVLFVAARGLHSPAEWNAWFTRLAEPAPLATWSEAFASEAGLAQRHNLAGFLRAVIVAGDEKTDAAAETALKLVP
jgi:hypothetical protein